jgi:2,6-dihydroxypseudooxynicotine hydrolase
VDQLVTSARDHWGPRFTANGVPAGDFERVMDQLEDWSQWCAVWSRAAARHEELGQEAFAEGRCLSAGEHFATAAAVYHFAKFVYVADLDQMRTAHQAAVRCHEHAMELVPFPGRKVRIPFDGAAIVGVLRQPAGTGPYPAVILAPGLDSTKEELRATEELFLQRGLATFAIDGPGQGEAEYDLPIRPDWEVVGAAVVDALAAMPEVDNDRIGVWGVSLGGYYAPRMASGEPRIKACAALCGPFDFGTHWDGKPELTKETFRVRSRSADMAEARKRAGELTLEGRTGTIRCPLLIISGRLDRIVPWQEQQRLHDDVSGSELLMLENGNHGCANVLAEHRYRTADWMAARLG